MIHIHNETYYKVEENRVDGCYSWFRITRCNPRSSLSYSIFLRKGQQNRLLTEQMINESKMCVLAVLAYRNSFINDKVNHSNIFLACRKKNEEKETNQVKEKLTTFFTKKPHSKTKVTQKSCTFQDILTTLLSRCLKVLSFFLNVFSRIIRLRIFSFNHEQHCYETALVPCIASSKI